LFEAELRKRRSRIRAAFFLSLEVGEAAQKCGGGIENLSTTPTFSTVFALHIDLATALEGA
jgi:hypothetical protein